MVNLEGCRDFYEKKDPLGCVDCSQETDCEMGGLFGQNATQADSERGWMGALPSAQAEVVEVRL